MMLAWMLLACAGVVAGAWVQDHWPDSIVARCVAMLGCAWFAGVWLTMFLLG